MSDSSPWNKDDIGADDDRSTSLFDAVVSERCVAELGRRCASISVSDEMGKLASEGIESVFGSDNPAKVVIKMFIF